MDLKQDFKTSKARQAWKRLWRLARIAKREHQKSMVDVAAYGNSMIFIDASGEAKHVPINEWSWEDK